MSERIVSPGVFTRERDLSFLPIGIGEIGAAIIGPTMSGPSFVPTVVTSFSDFETKFGSYSTDFYTPYTVKEYFKGNASSVTIVKVGYIGGYKASTFNVVSNGHVAGTFAPSAANNSGIGTIGGSLAASPQADGFELKIHGDGIATASLGIIALHTGVATSDLLHQSSPANAHVPKVGALANPGYLYKDFSRNHFPIPYFGANDATVSIEPQTDGLDFQSGTETVNSTTYAVSINGNKDASVSRTPDIIAQDDTPLFKIYNRIDGDDGNKQ